MKEQEHMHMQAATVGGDREEYVLKPGAAAESSLCNTYRRVCLLSATHREEYVFAEYVFALQHRVCHCLLAATHSIEKSIDTHEMHTRTCMHT
jgi:hypothetical protein